MSDSVSFLKAITSNVGEAVDLELRTQLLFALNEYFDSKGWKQQQIMEALDIPQPRASELTNNRVDLMSVGKLITYLGKLGYQLAPVFNPDTGFECSVKSFDY